MYCRKCWLLPISMEQTNIFMYWCRIRPVVGTLVSVFFVTLGHDSWHTWMENQRNVKSPQHQSGFQFWKTPHGVGSLGTCFNKRPSAHQEMVPDPSISRFLGCSTANSVCRCCQFHHGCKFWGRAVSMALSCGHLSKQSKQYLLIEPCPFLQVRRLHPT